MSNALDEKIVVLSLLVLSPFAEQKLSPKRHSRIFFLSVHLSYLFYYFIFFLLSVFKIFVFSIYFSKLYVFFFLLFLFFVTGGNL